MYARLSIAIAVLYAMTGVTQGTPSPQVAVAPFEVVNDSAGTLRAVATDCLDQLAAALSSKGVTVVRRTKLTEKALSDARPATLAVLGDFRREKGMIRAELRLMDVTTGDELRAYFNTSANAREIAAMGSGVAERIVRHIREKPE